MFNRMLAKQSVAAMLVKAPVRSFSLLMPLQPSSLAVPAEIISPALTIQACEELSAKYAKYNEECSQELATMNENLIDNIIKRDGIKGWETAENLDDLTKSFEFASFEQCQAFCQNVGVIA